MTNHEQLFLQLIGLTLAAITTILAVTKPVYDKLEDLGQRLVVIEFQLKEKAQRGAK